jgi:hypothetical protein
MTHHSTSLRTIRIIFVLGMAVSWTGLAKSADAQTKVDDGKRTTLIGYTENDDWPPDTGTDKNYTNGLRVTLSRNYDMWNTRRLVSALDKILRILPEVPDLRDCAEAQATERCASSSFHIGQQFYTPDDISIRELIPNDRPYAGWLYVGGSWRSSTLAQSTNVDVFLGFTGRPSLGKQVQTRWHAIVGATTPSGWDYEVGDRLGIIAAPSWRWAHDETRGGRRWLEFMPYFGGNAGNIITDAYGGVRLKIGHNVSRDWSHGIGPVLTASLQGPTATALPREQGRYEVYFVADGQGRGLAYNAFIDDAPSHDLDRRYFVADGGVGVAFRIARLTFSYRLAFISPEFEQASTHEFKALRVSWAFD